MNITTVNQLILDHLRFYGYQLAARIVESEIKTKPPREQPKPSKLLETLLKFVELYGKPDLWGSDASLQNISDNEDRRQIGLPRMDRAPFKGVHGNKSESYGGPFNRTKDNNEPYRITNSTARSDPIGRNTFASAGIKSTQMGMLGNKFSDIGPVGNPVKGTPNQHASHLTSIANALRDKSPPGGGVSLYQDQNMMMDMKRGGASSHQSSTYVGPYAIANQSFNKDEGRSFDERDNNSSFAGPVGYMPERNMEPFAPKRDKQTRSTSVPQAESKMYEGIMKERPVYGRRANNNTKHDSYIEDSEASTMDMEPSYASNPVVERDRAPMRNANPNPKSFYEGEAAAPQGGRVTFKRESQEQFGRVEKAVRPVPVHNEEREEMPRRDWKAASEKKPPGNGMIQDYNVFLARHGNQQERPFGSGTKVPQGRQGGNVPPTFRVDSESSMEANQPFGREYNQQQRVNKGGREEYKEGAPKVYFGERESQQNLFEKNQSMMERNQKFGEERFEGRTSQVEVGYGSRGGSKGYTGDNFERRRPPGEEYRNENRSFQGEERDRSGELDGQTLEYLKRDTKLQEGEIRRLYGIYAGLDGKLGYEGGLEKTKFTEFLKRGKGIDSRCFTDNLFKFGSQMGLLNGMPPKIGFEEALIVQNQLTQTNPTELMKFLFMVGSGGSRETKLSLIESMLKELQTGENRDVIGMLLDSINYASSQGRGSKEDLISLEKYWGMTADFEPLRRHF